METPNPDSQSTDIAFGAGMKNNGLLLSKAHDVSTGIVTNKRKAGPSCRLRISQIVGQTSIDPQHNGQVVSTIANDTLQSLVMGMMDV